MPEFTLGDYVLIELALASYAKDIDISLFAAQQIQKIVMKAEVNIERLSAASKPLRVVPLEEEKPPGPHA